MSGVVVLDMIASAALPGTIYLNRYCARTTGED